MIQTVPTIEVNAYDARRQRRFRLGNVSVDSRVRDLVNTAVPHMKLPGTDSQGRPVTYRARLDRAGRHLNDSEVIGDALQDKDAVSLHPSIEAG